MFTHYTQFFNTVEINSTFYRYPSSAAIHGLNRTSPKNFVFSAKLPKLITHKKHLNPDLEVKKDFLRFLELLDPLKTRNKLGCILIQLPPSFVYERDHGNLKVFLEMLPEDYEFAAEFRDYSWLRDDVWRLLKKHNVAYCVVDEPLLPPEVHITADFAYFRWHGRGRRPWYNYHYSEEELEKWVPRIEHVRNRVGKAYGYFNNHYYGYAIENCIELLEMLNAAKPEQTRVKEKIIKHNIKERPLVYQKKLEDYGRSLIDLGVDELLLRLTSRARVERGRKIKDSEVTIEELSEELIRAKIRKYTVEVNLRERVVKHDCDDWRKGLETKRLCKHIVKLLLMIPEEESVEILRDILSNKDKWTLITA